MQRNENKASDAATSKNRGVELRQVRKHLKITQRELSANTGIPVTHISGMENGKEIPKRHARILARMLKLGLDNMTEQRE